MTLAGAVAGFWLIALLSTITRGLDTALVLRAAITRSRPDAFATAVGMIGEVLAWGAAAAVGVSALLAASTLAYDVVRLVGAARMLWLGGRILWRAVRHSAVAPDDVGVSGSVGAWRSARAGLLTDLLNPLATTGPSGRFLDRRSVTSW